MQKIQQVVMCQGRDDFFVRIVRDAEYYGDTYNGIHKPNRRPVSWSSWRRLQRVLGDMVMQGRMTIKIELFDEGIITFERVQDEQASL